MTTTIRASIELDINRTLTGDTVVLYSPPRTPANRPALRGVLTLLRMTKTSSQIRSDLLTSKSPYDQISSSITTAQQSNIMALLLSRCCDRHWQFGVLNEKDKIYLFGQSITAAPVQAY